ncbi:MAG: glutamate racemase [Phycisphaerae bacterium]|nr:glutamate racemase [Phycisphaerae bacterium]
MANGGSSSDPAAAPIGVFDSGLGGLTVVRQLSRAMPGEAIVYLGDTARVPYGIRSLATVRQYALEDAAFLLRFAPKLIVVACNTASAAAVEALEAFCRPVDVVDVIRPSAAAALAASKGPIGVIGTEATVASGAYERAIHAIDPRRRVVAKACPLLVPIVEEGRDEADPIVLSVLSDYLRELQRLRPGAMILGCTHYPLLARAIGKLMGPDVALVESGESVAAEVQRRLRAAGLENLGKSGGTLRCFTTDNPQRFAQLSERFGGRKIDVVDLVGTDELRSAIEPADRGFP